MRKFLAAIFVLTAILIMAAGLEISQKIRVVILPAKTLQGWTEDDVDYLLSLLEETMLDLGRFDIYSRQNLKEIMKERGLSELGITEALEVGEIASARYVILLTLNELVTGYDYDSGNYYASTNLSIKLLDITDGKVVATKTVSEKAYGKTTAEAKQTLFGYLRNDFELIIRNFFKLKASVAQVVGSKVLLQGVDTKLLKLGMIFKIEGGLGREGYVKVIGERNRMAEAEILYGYVAVGADAVEYPMMGVGGSVSLDYYTFGSDYVEGYRIPAFGFSISSWSYEAPVFLGLAFLAGSSGDYMPFTFDLGGRMEFLHFGQIFVGGRLGFSMFGIYDSYWEEIVASLFGAVAGVDGRYEFNPSMGVSFKYDLRWYLGGINASVISIGLYFGM